MSTTLFWKPRYSDNDLPDELKFKIREEYALPTTLSYQDLKFLKGLIVCDVKGAKELYEAIEKYDEVEVYERH